MSHAEIEECEDSVVVVCPWHRYAIRPLCFGESLLIQVNIRYDFDLRTGESETGLRACTYTVKVEPHEKDGVYKVWVEAPDNSGWRLVELRPVSEGMYGRDCFSEIRYDCPLYLAFADLPPAVAKSIPESVPSVPIKLSEDLVPSNGAPCTLMEWAVLILNTSDPMLKVGISLFLHLSQV